jgi:hypothetical protein
MVYNDNIELELYYEGNQGKKIQIEKRKNREYNCSDLSLLIIGKKNTKTAWSKRAQLFQLNDERFFECNIKYCINRRLFTMIFYTKNRDRQIYTFNDIPKLDVCKTYAWNIYSKKEYGLEFNIFEIDEVTCNIKHICSQIISDFHIPQMNKYTLWINENCNSNCFADVSIDYIQIKWDKITIDNIKKIVNVLYLKQSQDILKNIIIHDIDESANIQKNDQIVYKRRSLDIVCGEQVIINKKTIINDDGQGNIQIQRSIKYKKQN